MSTHRHIPGTNAVDLSSLTSPSPNPSPSPTSPPASPTTANPRRPITPLGAPSPVSPNASNPYGEDVKELTPSEQNEAAILAGALMKKYSDKVLTESVARQLENEARERFAEQLGLIVTVSWDGEEDQVTVDADPNSDRIWFCPSIIIEARTDRHEIDFEKIQQEVRAGEADGQPGVLRNGEWHDDTKKKNIY